MRSLRREDASPARMKALVQQVALAGAARSERKSRQTTGAFGEKQQNMEKDAKPESKNRHSIPKSERLGNARLAFRTFEVVDQKDPAFFT